ncbi:MAG: efflux RND transporter permease subunit [Candidatus Electronema sp. VV]
MANISIIYTRAVAASSGSSAFEANTPNHVGIRFIDLAERTESSHDTVEEIRRRIADIPGAKLTVAMEAEGPPTGAPINIEIAGDRFEVLGAAAKEVKNALSKLPHVEDIRDDYVEGTPSVQVKIDRQKAASFGLTTGMIGFALKSAYNGLAVSTFREGSDDYDITVQLPEAERRHDGVLRSLMIPAPNGQAVPLSALAEISVTGSVGSISRINHERVVTVKANVDETKILARWPESRRRSCSPRIRCRPATRSPLPAKIRSSRMPKPSSARPSPWPCC